MISRKFYIDYNIFIICLSEVNEVVKLAFNLRGALSNKVFQFVFVMILMAIVVAMTALSGSASIAIQAMIDAIVDWKELLGLGFVLAVLAIFYGRR